MTCKNCIGYEYCNPQPKNPRNVEKWCNKFKNKADFVKVRRGEWEASVMGTGAPHCSLCKGVAPLRYTYCPNCGADMRGGRK